MWKIVKEVIGGSPSKNNAIDELNGPNVTAKEKVDIANTQDDFFRLQARF